MLTDVQAGGDNRRNGLFIYGKLADKDVVVVHIWNQEGKRRDVHTRCWSGQVPLSAESSIPASPVPCKRRSISGGIVCSPTMRCSTIWTPPGSAMQWKARSQISGWTPWRLRQMRRWSSWQSCCGGCESWYQYHVGRQVVSGDQFISDHGKKNGWSTHIWYAAEMEGAAIALGFPIPKWIPFRLSGRSRTRRTTVRQYGLRTTEAQAITHTVKSDDGNYPPL